MKKKIDVGWKIFSLHGAPTESERFRGRSEKRDGLHKILYFAKKFLEFGSGSRA